MSEKKARYLIVQYDKERKLRYTVNAFTDYEIASGRGIAEILANPLAMTSFKEIRSLLWAGFKWQTEGKTREFPDDPILSLQETGEIMNQLLIDGKKLEDMIYDIKDALNLSGLVSAEIETPDAVDGKPAKKKKQ